GGGAHRPPVGPARPAAQVTRRIPWGLLLIAAALAVPALGSRFYTFLANDVLIWALFATSLNLLVGYTGLVSFGHAAYFGIGAYVRRYELAAFVLAGAFAGLAGGLFGIFNRGVFPDFAYWTKSSEVLIMTLLGGMGMFYGPALGALVLILLNQQIVSYTEYW